MHAKPMITARNYYDNVVKPTVTEFCNNNKDLRLALLASMAVLHVVDYVMHNRESDPKKADREVKQYSASAGETFAFRVLRDFALASKHCRLHDNRLHSGEHMVAYPSFTGVMRAGQSFFGDTTGGITIQWDKHQHVNLTHVLLQVLNLFERDFPELTM